MHVDVPPVSFKDLKTEDAGEASKQVRKRVIAARDIQRQRFASLPGLLCNSDMGPGEVERFCPLHPEAAILLERAMDRLGHLCQGLPPAFLRYPAPLPTWPVTAPLAQAHVAEAVGYRRPLE